MTTRTLSNIESEQELCAKLKALYLGKDSIDDPLTYEVCGQFIGITSFHYNPSNKILPNQLKKVLVFMEYESLKDPTQITYKYQTLIAALSVSSIGQKDGRKVGKVFLSMCALGHVHGEYHEGRFFLLQIFQTLCVLPQLDFLVLDRANLGKPSQIFKKSLNDFYIVPEYKLSNEQYLMLLQRRRLEMERLSLFYDPYKAKPRTTPNPHGWEQRNGIFQNPDGSFDIPDNLKKIRDDVFELWRPIQGSKPRNNSVTDLTANHNDSNAQELPKSDRLRPRTQLEKEVSPIIKKRPYTRRYTKLSFKPQKPINSKTTTNPHESTMLPSFSSLTRNDLETCLHSQQNYLQVELKKLNDNRVSFNDIALLKEQLNSKFAAEDRFRSDFLQNQTSTTSLINNLSSQQILNMSKMNEFQLEQRNLPTKDDIRAINSSIYSNVVDTIKQDNEVLRGHVIESNTKLSSAILNQSNAFSTEFQILKGLVQQTIEDRKDKEHREQVESLNRIIHDRNFEREERFREREERGSERKLLFEVVKELNGHKIKDKKKYKRSRKDYLSNQEDYLKDKYHPYPTVSRSQNSRASSSLSNNSPLFQSNVYKDRFESNPHK
jgi:hypothetical protein